MRDRLRWVIVVALIAIAFAGGALKDRLDAGRAAPAAGIAGGHDELPSGGFFTLLDEKDAPLAHTGHVVAAGDEYITEDNRVFRVSEIAEGKARCKLVSSSPAMSDAAVSGGDEAHGTLAQGQSGAVGIYHTHTDEAYEPTEGTESVRQGGGVVRVGTVLRDALKGKSLNAIQDSTNHAPHDAMAYSRSRRTAMRLVSQAKAALFDVHRDAAPPGEYTKQVAGKKVTQIMLVVGRQNPKYQANLEFAKRLKATVDKTHPGLIRGILVAGGNFNQDLSDRALLLEVGADSNSRGEAEQAVRLLADDIPKVVGAATTPGGGLTGTTGAQGRSAARALGGLLIVAAIAVVGYLFISTGGLREASSKVRKIGGRELANFLGGRSRESRASSKDGSEPPGSGEGRGADGSSSGGDDNKGGCGS